MSEGNNNGMNVIPPQNPNGVNALISNANSLLAVISVVTILIGGGVAWGMLQSKVTKLEIQLQTVAKDYKDMQLYYVTKEEFRSVINELKDDNKEIKRDIKTILTKISGK